MTQSENRTPYQVRDPRKSRRRTILIVIAVVVVTTAGLALHVMGVLPPK